jgi:hypothetical protein
MVLQFLSFSIVAQKQSSEEDFKEYFISNHEQLDPIEGIWVVNVNRSLYLGDELLVSEVEENISQWAVKADEEGTFRVHHIGKGFEGGKMNFEAFFEKTSIDRLYAYECQFTKPKWKANANAILESDQLIELEYYTSEEFMKKAYKKDYVPGLKLHWYFVWIKKYPFDSNSITKEQLKALSN